MSLSEQQSLEIKRQLRLKMIENGADEAMAAQVVDVAFNAAEQAQERLQDLLFAAGGHLTVAAFPVAIDLLIHNLGAVRTAVLETAERHGCRTVTYTVGAR